MSLEELLVEHIKALNENTKAIVDYTQSLRHDTPIEVEHTKNSACQFCGISYKTIQSYLENGLLRGYRRKTGRREYFKEKDLIALCESRHLYSGQYGKKLKQYGR